MGKSEVKLLKTMTDTDLDAMRDEIEELKETTAMLSDLVTSLASNQQNLIGVVEGLANSDGEDTEAVVRTALETVGLDLPDESDGSIEPANERPADDRMFN